MSCYSPLKAFDIGETNKGKRKYKITGLDVDHLEKDKNGNWIKVYDSYVSDMAHDIKRKFIEIPCGKCIGCRLSYAKQWSERCLMELEGHKSSYFVTLTYDDVNLPMTTFVEPENGVICEINTLVKEDFRNFMKALRQATNQKRYFAVTNAVMNLSEKVFRRTLYVPYAGWTRLTSRRLNLSSESFFL